MSRLYLVFLLTLAVGFTQRPAAAQCCCVCVAGLKDPFSGSIAFFDDHRVYIEEILPEKTKEVKEDPVAKTITKKDSGNASEIVTEKKNVVEQGGETEELKETKVEKASGLEPEKETIIEKEVEKEPGKANETVLVIEKKNETSLEGKESKITEKEVKLGRVHNGHTDRPLSRVAV